MKSNGFGDRLKELLKQKQLTQAQVANAVGTSVPSVNRWTKGGEIEYDNLRTLAEFLEVNWVWLRYGDEAIQSLQQTMPDNDTVTDMRREYLNQILENETKMKSALEMAQIINWEWNVLTGALSLSDNAESVLGTNHKSAESVILPFAETKLEDLISLFSSNEPYSWDFELASGEQTKWFSCKAELVFDSLQRPVKVIGVTVDITARKQAEQDLERSEYMLRKIIDLIPVGLWAADKQGTICLANPEVKRIWGGAKYVSLDHYGEYKGWWDTTGEEVGPEGWTLARAVSDGESSTPEVVNIEAFDGENRTIIMYATPLYDSENNIIGAIEVNQDITDSKTTERTLSAELAPWHSLLAQTDLDVITLNRDSEIQQLSHGLRQLYSDSEHLKLTDIFEPDTCSTVHSFITGNTSTGVSTLPLSAKLINKSAIQHWTLIKNNRDNLQAAILLIALNNAN